MILAIARAFGARVGWNPWRSDFGALIFGKHKVDVTGGRGGLVVLLTRFISGEAVTLNGKTYSLTTGKYRAPNRLTVVGDYLGNKLGPMPALTKDVLTQNTFGGGKPTVAGEAMELVTPFPVKTFMELRKDRAGAAETLLLMITDSLGGAVSDSNPKK